MSANLEKLKSQLQAAYKASTTGTQLQAILGYLEDLVDEVLEMQKDSGQSIPDELINLRIENQNLKSKVASLDSLLNQQTNDIINPLRTILNINPEQPSTQLVPLAQSIMKQLEELKKLHNQ